MEGLLSQAALRPLGAMQQKGAGGGEWGRLVPQLSEELPTPADSCTPQPGQGTSLLPRAHGSRDSKALALPQQDACAGMPAMLPPQ